MGLASNGNVFWALKGGLDRHCPKEAYSFSSLASTSTQCMGGAVTLFELELPAQLFLCTHEPRPLEPYPVCLGK
jgi:hypothetical protein